jgi:hypothetical protein
MANPENASDTTSAPKRARIDPALKPPSHGTETASRPIAPKGLATSFAKGHVATLHPQVSSILHNLFDDFLAQKTQIFNKEHQVKKMETNHEFFPRSARIDFRFHLSDDAKALDEYSTLLAATTQEIDGFKAQLKIRITQATQIELYVMRTKLRALTVKAIRIASKAFLIIEDPTKDDVPTDITARAVISLLGPSFFSILYFQSTDDVLAVYNKQHKTTLAPFQAPAQAQDTSDSIVLNDATLNPATGPPPTPTASKVAHTLKELFVTSWAQYLDQTQRNALRIKLRQFSVQALDEPATDNAAMVTNAEPNVDPQIVADMIQAEVSKKTKHLTIALSKLQNQLASSKNPKGRKSDASSVKQNKRSSSPTRGNRKAADADNATPSAAAKKGNNRKNNKSTKKSDASKSSRPKPRSQRGKK